MTHLRGLGVTAPELDPEVADPVELLLSAGEVATLRRDDDRR